MAVEDLVDDFWRDALKSKLSGPQAEAKWNAFIHGLKDRVANFPQEAQDEVFMRAAKSNVELGLPPENNPLVEEAAEERGRRPALKGSGAFLPAILRGRARKQAPGAAPRSGAPWLRCARIDSYELFVCSAMSAR
ncbi:hypothetical protein [Bradyrhizobium sp. LA7.1]|uniref:hypothetical protein n=1 Tax=Bradyrhizobium sp. LA7.1 TaxID=3156324 RepID=UPI003399DDB9